MNTLKLLNYGSNILKFKNVETHTLDSEILLSKVLNKSREKLLINFDHKVNKENTLEFKKFIKRRSKNEPLAYIISEKEFWSKSFFVDNSTLIPRPETELMVEKLVKKFRNRSINILDIGTGSGCILISLLIELTNSKGVGIDISKKAIKVAKKNVKRHCLENKIKLKSLSLSDLFVGKFDLVVSNPPYIRSTDLKNLSKDIKFFEPKIALDGGNDGLDLIKKVIYKSKYILKTNGMLALEIGNGQYNKVSTILKRNNFKIEHIIKDFNKNVRCIISMCLNK